MEGRGDRKYRERGERRRREGGERGDRGMEGNSWTMYREKPWIETFRVVDQELEEKRRRKGRDRETK